LHVKVSVSSLPMPDLFSNPLHQQLTNLSNIIIDMMNEDLIESWKRKPQFKRKGKEKEKVSVDVLILPQKLNARVRAYFDDTKRPMDAGSWVDRPEFPTAGEILDLESDGSSNSDIVEIVPNRPTGVWESKGTSFDNPHFTSLLMPSQKRT
jgi:hypothetical protein